MANKLIMISCFSLENSNWPWAGSKIFDNRVSFSSTQSLSLVAWHTTRLYDVPKEYFPYNRINRERMDQFSSTNSWHVFCTWRQKIVCKLSIVTSLCSCTTILGTMRARWGVSGGISGSRTSPRVVLTEDINGCIWLN